MALFGIGVPLLARIGGTLLGGGGGGGGSISADDFIRQLAADARNGSAAALAQLRDVADGGDGPSSNPGQRHVFNTAQILLAASELAAVERHLVANATTPGGSGVAGNVRETVSRVVGAASTQWLMVAALAIAALGVVVLLMRRRPA